MPRTYVDNAMNRNLGRVGMPHGSAVHSSSSSGSGSRLSYSSSSLTTSSSLSSPRTYVDNPMNRGLGRVGQPLGTAVHSRTSSGGSSSNSGYSQVSPKTYVDNAQNRSLDRVGLVHGTAVHSARSSDNSNDSGYSGASKTYADNPLNNRLGRVGMLHGSAVHSRSDYNSTRSSVGQDPVKRYKDNPLNRKLNRVDLPLGTAVYSRGSTSVSPSVSPPVTQAKKTGDNGPTSSCDDIKCYKDNPYNRKHKRVGLPLGSKPISRKKPVCRNTQHKIELDQVGKLVTSEFKRKNQLPQLLAYLENNLEDDLPEELEDMLEDDINTVYEFNNREQEFQRFLAERSDSAWAAHEHTPVEVIRSYKGNVIKWTDLELGQLIGHGGFGEVYFAFLNGQAVAVKKLKVQKLTKKRLNEFIAEIEVYVKLNHPNIVSYLGACTDVANPAIVMEYMDMSLYDALHIKEVDFYNREKLDIVRGVTKGLAYLHQQNIAHCDMKTQNVLLINVPGEHLYQEDQPVLAKITDFGLSKMKSDTETSTSCLTRNLGTPRYSAPEIQRGELLTPSQLQLADIFSLGLLIWELAVQEIPFEDLTPQQLRVQVGEKGLLPETPSRLTLNPDLQETLSQMWRITPANRPTAASLAAEAEKWSTMVEQDEE